jgi:hypothetical protein
MSENIHIIVGDAHAKPGISNERFRWLGNMVVDYHVCYPDATISVIDMGDWADMPSLSSYDIGKKSYEGRRYRQDLEAAWEARQEFGQPIADFNKAAKFAHKTRFRPRLIALGGNHDEGRINRAIELSPMLEGTINAEKDLRYADFGWKYIPYLEPYSLDGITYSHYFVSGVMGRSIGGEYPAVSLIRKQLTSCVSGHSHLLDFAHRTDAHGNRIWGVFAGCFLAEEQWEDYATQANNLWWKGIVVLRNVKDGDFDIETYEISRIKELWSK